MTLSVRSAPLLGAFVLLLAFVSCAGDVVQEPGPPAVPGDPGVVVGPGSGAKKATLHAGRVGASATVLEDGRIVIIGGAIPKEDADPKALAVGDPAALDTILDTVEIYDPTTGQVTALATDPLSPQTLYFSRAFHEATLFPGTNRIAVSGGYTQLGEEISVTASVEVFNVDQAGFQSANSVPPLSKPRVHHTTTLLDYRDSKGSGDLYMLVAGGLGDARVSYEVWSPNGVRSTGAIPVAPRWNHRAIRVEGAYTFLIGGEDNDSTVSAIDVFDKDTGKFLQDGQIPESLQAGGRLGHAVAYDPEMRVVYVIGGYTDKARTRLEPHIEVISTETGLGLAPVSAGFVLNEPRAYHAASFLPGGRVLVSGGIGEGGTLVPVTEILEKKGGKIGAELGVSILPSRFLHVSVGMSADTAVLLGGGAPVSGGGVSLETTVDVIHTL